MSYAISPGGLPILAVCALVVLIWIALVGFIMWRIKNGIRRGILLLAVIGIPLFALYVGGFIGSSAARLTRDHSFRVPASVTNIHCDDFVSLTTFIDSAASARFEMARGDIPTLLSQFKESTPRDTDDSGLKSSSKDFGKLIRSFDGGSHDGNVMHIDIYDLDPRRVGVCIYTVWN